MILCDLKYEREFASRIAVEPGALNRLEGFELGSSSSHAALIADADVLELHGHRVLESLKKEFAAVTVFTIPPGENGKTLETVADLQDRLSDAGVDRSGLIVGLGGGVVLDIAGFVAATYLRGIPWVALPTSLLAQVDAGIGGKTGVNTASGKNRAGAFHPPFQVVVDPEVLQTLPLIEWKNGLAEAVKHSWIADENLFAQFEQQPSSLKKGAAAAALDWLAAAITVKTSVVAEDPFEQGKRSILNAGHTIGHAVETASSHAVKHGFAVARGMVVEARASGEDVGLPEEHVLRLEQLLHELDLLPSAGDLDFDSLLPFLRHDKKNLNGRIRVAVPVRLGKMVEQEGSWTVPVQLESLRHAWESLH